MPQLELATCIYRVCVDYFAPRLAPGETSGREVHTMEMFLNSHIMLLFFLIHFVRIASTLFPWRRLARPICKGTWCIGQGKLFNSRSIGFLGWLLVKRNQVDTIQESPRVNGGHTLLVKQCDRHHESYFRSSLSLKFIGSNGNDAKSTPWPCHRSHYVKVKPLVFLESPKLPPSPNPSHKVSGKICRTTA